MCVCMYICVVIEVGGKRESIQPGKSTKKRLLTDFFILSICHFMLSIGDEESRSSNNNEIPV